MSEIDCIRREPLVRAVARCLVVVAAASGLAATGGADPKRVGEEGSVKARVFSKREVENRLKSLGVVDEPTSLARLPRADGVRITLSSESFLELRCDGSIERGEMPSRRTYFDAHGRPFAWYEGQHLRFAAPWPEVGVGNTISVDPNGRYFLATDVRSQGNKARIYAVDYPPDPVGTTPLVGNRTKVFSRPHGVIVVGDAADRSDGVIAIVYDFNHGELLERERIAVQMPDTWFGGWLVAEDATLDASEILFGFWRDPPFSNQLYVFDFAARRTRHLSKLRGYAAYVACDPIRSR